MSTITRRRDLQNGSAFNTGALATTPQLVGEDFSPEVEMVELDDTKTVSPSERNTRDRAQKSREVSQSGETDDTNTVSPSEQNTRNRIQKSREVSQSAEKGEGTAFGINAERGPNAADKTERSTSSDAVRGTPAQGSTSTSSTSGGTATTSDVPTQKVGEPTTSDVSVTGAVSVGFQEVIVLLAAVVAFFFLN